MATTDKKYLDLTGLQHLLNKLNSENRIVKHSTDKAKTEGAYKITVDANGHVTAGDALKVGDIQNAAAKSDIKDATITLSINGIKKTFTTNQATADTLAWTLSDLGFTNALHFKGVLTELPATTNYVEGDVVLVGNKEYVLALNGASGAKKWNELGDAESHALKSVKIEGDGTFITGGGSLASNRTLSHKLYNGAATKGAYKIAIDNAGHISESEALTIASNGSHTHTTKVTIPASTYVGTVTPTTQKLSISKKANTAATETVVKSYPGSSSKLVTTSVTGVSGSTTASKATAGTAVTVAKAGTAVTVATKAASATVVGNANRATAATTVMTGLSTDKTAYNAAYNTDDECLVLSAVTFTPATKGIYEATASETTIYGCGNNTSVVPAVANGSITPYTFDDVTVPKAATAATTVATGSLSTTGTGGAVLIGLGTASTATVIKTESTYNAVLGTTGDVDVVSSVSSSQVAAKEITATVENAGNHGHSFN